VGRSNFSLAGAVMPFVQNDISNVSLPISAVAAGGAKATAGLPIEFTGGNVGVAILQSPGPISFGGPMEGQAGQPSDPLFSVVYSPAASSATTASLPVSLQVLGTYDNGEVGPMPSDVQVSFPQPSFELAPYSVFYFPVAENNSLKPSNVTPSVNYVFAVREMVGNSTYLMPLTVSVSLVLVFAGGPAQTGGASTTGVSSNPGVSSYPAAGPTGLSSNPPGVNVLLVIAAAGAIAVVASAAFVLWHSRVAKGKIQGGNP
jgi:hypothetical protein